MSAVEGAYVSGGGSVNQQGKERKSAGEGA
jgi:hypothetical protein